ncbi:MAG TPA: hypothetical protein VNT50_09850 [Microbacterium sp.]|uniref:hypothetical protein n=1 Tax=Microbacterium sp. TaxID=51671 RepID=UPI002CB9094E|nr:hypothetical protein [Microbacterium sp.]HWI31783.1 hypothetical protein [Microbacterium sp.]
MATVDAAHASAPGAGGARLGAVRIAWADAADVVDAVRPLALAGLAVGQLRRYEAMEGALAARFLVGRWLLADLVAEVCDTDDFVLSNRCEQCGADDHGAPRVSGADAVVSVSYARGLVAVAAAHLADAAALGIDIETGTPAGPLTELAPLFAPGEPPDLRGWTLIEAALKADGRGLRVAPAAVRLGADGALLPAARRVLIAGLDDGIEAAPAPAPEGFVLSVAVRSGARPR